MQRHAIDEHAGRKLPSSPMSLRRNPRIESENAAPTSRLATVLKTGFFLRASERYRQVNWNIPVWREYKARLYGHFGRRYWTWVEAPSSSLVYKHPSGDGYDGYEKHVVFYKSWQLHTTAIPSPVSEAIEWQCPVTGVRPEARALRYSNTQRDAGPIVVARWYSRQEAQGWLEKHNLLGELPDPPESTEELQDVLRAVQNDDCKKEEWRFLAIRQAEEGLSKSLWDAMGEHLQRKGLDESVANSIVDSALDRVSNAITCFKIYFDRVRPVWLANHQGVGVEDWLVLNPGHPSYPSGHATQAHAVKIAICQHLNEDTSSITYKELHDWASDVARNRERLGLHYPSDSSAGEKLAVVVLNTL